MPKRMSLHAIVIRVVSFGMAAVVLIACGKAPTAASLLTQGLAAHAKGNIAEAQLDYRKVLEKEPGNKFAYYNLGLIEQTKSNDAAAEANYRLALVTDPNFTPALYNLAIIRTRAGAKQEAVDLYRKVIELTPKNAAAHLNLGFLLRDMHKLDEGDKEIRLGVSLDPSLASRVPASSPDAAASP